VLCPEHCGGLCPLPTKGVILCPSATLQPMTLSRASVLTVPKVFGKYSNGRGVCPGSSSDWSRRTRESDSITRQRFVVRLGLIPLLISTGVSSASHPLLALRRIQHLLLSTSLSHLSESGSNEEHQKVLDDAIRTAAKVISGLREVLPMGHPIRGLHLAETGKLLAADEFASIPQSNSHESFPPTGAARLNLAFRNLVEARQELLIGFGQENGGGQVGEEVRKLIISLETEIGIWKDGVRTALEEQGTANRVVRR